MDKGWKNLWQVELPAANEHALLHQRALARNWGLALLATGWLHLAAFTFCYYLTIVQDYHEPFPYLAVWLGEALGTWLIFRICGGPRPAAMARLPLEMLVRRIWLAYFILSFNLASLNTLRGHTMFEFFPAIGTLASFAFLMMTLLVSWRFFGAVLVMFGCALLMAAYLWHAYLCFALAWWLVLNGIGVPLWLERRRSIRARAAATRVSERAILVSRD